MTAHRSQSTPTSASAAIPQWTGTPAEWDAERDRRAERLRDGHYSIHLDACIKTAAATMPPRPVEPPSVVTASGWRVTWDGRDFLCSYVVNSIPTTVTRSMAHSAASWCSATEAEHDAIRALRDGPAPRYEVCGWETWKDGVLQTAFRVEYNSVDICESEAKRRASAIGGTAHAIYRRVEGDK